MKFLRNALAVFFLIILSQHLNGESDNIFIGKFSEGKLEDWKNKELKGRTSYSLATSDGRQAIMAKSNGTASAFLKQVYIDLDKTPYLNWSWKIDRTLNIEDETIKPGDDFAARIYVIVRIGWSPWGVNAINYVWSSAGKEGSDWPNPFSNKARMIAVKAGDRYAGQWKQEKRNIQKDFEKAFNTKIRYIDAIAIMTDTDNSQSQAVAYYGDIYFSAR